MIILICIYILLRFIINNINIFIKIINEIPYTYYNENIVYVNSNSDNNSGNNSNNSSSQSDDSGYGDMDEGPYQTYGSGDQPDPEEQSVEKAPSSHNAPEQLQDDLDKVDEASDGDSEANLYLRRNYPAFFDQDDESAFQSIRAYIYEEFEAELRDSERKADELDEAHRAELERQRNLAELNEENQRQLDYDKSISEHNKRERSEDQELLVNNPKKKTKLSSSNEDNGKGGPGSTEGPSGSTGGYSGPDQGSSSGGNSLKEKITYFFSYFGIFVSEFLEKINNLFFLTNN